MKNAPARSFGTDLAVAVRCIKLHLKNLEVRLLRVENSPVRKAQTGFNAGAVRFRGGVS
jgi:hypothetical protein